VLGCSKACCSPTPCLILTPRPAMRLPTAAFAREFSKKFACPDLRVPSHIAQQKERPRSALRGQVAGASLASVGMQNHSDFPSIQTCQSIHEVFDRLVREATEVQDYQPTVAASAYVTSVLVDYTHPSTNLEEPGTRPLSLLLLEALSAQGAERFARLRSLGDGVLYFAGFFAEYELWREVDVSYAEEIGARAYSEASSMLRFAVSERDEPGVSDLFRELSQEFTAFVTLVRAVSEMLLANAHQSDATLVALYERWLASGSRAVAEALARHGVIAVRAAGGRTCH
jgi:hypothetical protein